MITDELINPIRIRLVEQMPFPLWDGEDFLGEDFDELSAWLGISRSTYDALADLQRAFDEREPGEIILPAELAERRELVRTVLEAELRDVTT